MRTAKERFKRKLALGDKYCEKHDMSTWVRNGKRECGKCLFRHTPIGDEDGAWKSKNNRNSEARV